MIEPTMICDGCGDRVGAFLQGAFDADIFYGFLATFDVFTKTIDGGRIYFFFCASCIFASVKDEADDHRFIALVKETLGIVNSDYESCAIN